MFAEAIINDDEKLARSRLELDIDPRENINIDGKAEIASSYALNYGKLSAVRVIIMHSCKLRANEELECLLPLILASAEVTAERPFLSKKPRLSRRSPYSVLLGNGLGVIRLVSDHGAKATLVPRSRSERSHSLGRT